MMGQHWGAWAAGLGALAGFWGLAGVVLGALPTEPSPSVLSRVGAVGEAEHWEHSYQWTVTRSLPCLPQRLTLTLGLTLQTETVSDGDMVDVAGMARLAVVDAEPYALSTSPILSRFAFSSPRYGGPGAVHEVRAALAGSPDVVTVGVGIVQGTDGASRLILQPGQVTMTCR